VRTTVTINDHLLGEVKLLAARTHRTIGSIVEDALQKLFVTADRGFNRFAELRTLDPAQLKVVGAVQISRKGSIRAPSSLSRSARSS
jgi:hypothetical protein